MTGTENFREARRLALMRGETKETFSIAELEKVCKIFNQLCKATSNIEHYIIPAGVEDIREALRNTAEKLDIYLSDYGIQFDRPFDKQKT